MLVLTLMECKTKIILIDAFPRRSKFNDKSAYISEISDRIVDGPLFSHRYLRHA